MHKIIDGKLGELSTLADQLSLNSEIKKAVYARTPVSSFQRFNMIKAQELLQQAVLVNKLVDKIYLYLPHSDYILSNETRYEFDDFKYAVRENFGLDFTIWEDLILNENYRDLHIIGNTGNGSHSTFMFVQKMMFSDINILSSVIVILIDGNLFTDLLESLRWNNEGLIHIEDSKGMYISHPAHFENNSGDFFSDSVQSLESGWEYSYLIPSGEYLASLYSVKKYMFVYFISCISCGLLLSLYLAIRNYMPIDKLLQEKADLSKTLHTQNESLRESILAKLILGNETKQELLIESCRASGINFLSSRFFLLTISIKDQIKSLDGEIITHDSISNAQYQNLIKRALEKKLEDGLTGYVTEVLGITTCFVSLTSEKDNISNQIGIGKMMSTLMELCKSFNDEFSMRLSIAVSNIYCSFREIPRAFDEVNRIRDYITLFGKEDGIIHASDMVCDNDSNSNYTSSFTLIRSITYSIQVHDTPKAIAEIATFIEKELKDPSISIQTAKLRMAGITNTLFNAFGSLKMSFSDREWHDMNIQDKLLSIKSINDLERISREIFYDLDRYSKSRSEETQLGIDEMLTYIKENRNDICLNVGSIADHFEVSMPYLSRWFKKEMGIGLLDFINLHRVQDAKIIIQDSSLNIHEIASKVGFGSRNTLVRAFKRYEGQLPSYFRDK